METLLEIDDQVFLFINHLGYLKELNFVTPILDRVMVFLSMMGRGGVVWLVLGVLMAWGEKKRSLKGIIDFLWPLFLSLVLTHLLVNITLKPLVGRMRPNFVILEARVLGRVLDDFSFPSGHATSSFAAAFVLGKKKKRLKILFYLLATLISFSRIYIGVHYPLDVIMGLVLGVGIGKMAVVVDRTNRTYRTNKKER